MSQPSVARRSRGAHPLVWITSPVVPLLALVSSTALAVTYYATYKLDGGTASWTGQTYTATAADTSAVWVTSSGKLTLADCALKTSGNTSSQENSSFYGLNAALLATSGGSAAMTGGSITTTGTGANGAFAVGSTASVSLTNVTINASADGGHGVMATQGGTVTLSGVDITTAGGASSAIATDRGGGTINVTGGTVKVSGGNSAGLYSTGTLNVTGTTFTSSGAEMAVIEGANSITLKNASLTSTKEKWGVMVYQSMSGDAQGKLGVFTMTGGSLAYTPASGPLFYVNNTTAIITLTGVAITSGSETLLKAAAGSWGTSGSNGGTVTLTASGQALPGSLVVDSISSLTATLKDGSSLTGAIDAAKTAKAVALTLDASSTWHVTADSRLTSLTETGGTTAAALANIDDNGHTITYDATAAASSWLGGKTYTLKDGGLLRPAGSAVAPTVTFSASPAQVAAGGSSTLTWATSNATTVSIDNGIGTVNASGSLSVSPSATTTYTLTATGAGGTAIASTTVAVSATRVVFVPAVLSSSGLNGSSFTSEMTLTNRGSTDARLAFRYTASVGSGTGTATATLAAGRQLVVPDAIVYLRGLGVPIAATGNQVGTLRVTFTGLSSEAAGGVTVRTTTAVPSGRAGLAYAGVPLASALTGVSYLCGLRQDGVDRSNVAVQNAGGPDDGAITLRLTVFSGAADAPVSQALPDVTLWPGDFTQVGEVLASNGLSIVNGYVKVERLSGTAPYTAYGVVNDEASSDGSFVPALPAATLAATTEATLPVLTETAAYSTELVLTNLSATRQTLSFSWVASALTSAGHEATFSLELAAGQQLILPGVVELLRTIGVSGIPARGATLAGPLDVWAASGDLAGIAVSARVTTPGDGGRYGVFFPASPMGAGATPEVWLLGLRQDAENRSNVALVNTGWSDATADTLAVELYDGASGLLVATLTRTLAAREWLQLDAILASAAPSTAQAYARVRRTGGSNPFLAYAVVNDGATAGERSGDGTFVAAAP